MATTRSILHVLDAYQKSRLSFVQTVSELATNPQNVELLHGAGIIQFLKVLLVDSLPLVQQFASLALGRLANHSEDLAEAIVYQGIHLQAVQSLKELDKYSKRPAAHVLSAISKHTPELAQTVANIGGVQQLTLCLEEFDPAVKETGASGLGNIARHNAELAECVINACAIPLLVLCVQESDLPLQRSSVLALAEVAKHGPTFAQVVAEASALALVAPLLACTDARLKRQACYCLSSIAKHSADLAKIVIAAGVFPKIFMSLKDNDPQVRRNAAIVIREVCKHTTEAAEIVLSSGGAAIIENITDTNGSERLPGIMAVGYIAAFDEGLAKTVINLNGIPPLLDAFTNEEEDHIKSASAWSIGQIGKHSFWHALMAAQVGVLPKLVSTLLSHASSEDLKSKCTKALNAIIGNLCHLPALDSLLQGPTLPEDILRLVLAQLSKVLVDADARTQFVKSGGFEKLQRLTVKLGSELRELVDHINGCYPIEIVHYYSPDYSQLLLQSLSGSDAQLTTA